MKRKRANSAPASPDRAARKLQKTNTSNVAQDSEGDCTEDDEEKVDATVYQKGTCLFVHILTSCIPNYIMIELKMRVKPMTTAQSKSAPTKTPAKRSRRTPPSEHHARKVRKMNVARHVIQDSEDEAESNGEDDNDNDDNKEDASESYAHLKADRLAEGCNRKVRKLFAFRFPSTQCSLLFQPSRKHQHQGHDKRTEDI